MNNEQANTSQRSSLNASRWRFRSRARFICQTRHSSSGHDAANILLPVRSKFELESAVFSHFFRRAIVVRPLSTSTSPIANKKPSSTTSISGKSKSHSTITADSTLHFDCAVCVIPHPSKADKGGEDAFFTHPFAIGVSDGVGGWNDAGIDPSLYSRALVAGSLKAAQTNQSVQRKVLTPQFV